MSNARPTYWTPFDLAEGASAQQVKSAYARLAKVHHPDKETGNADLWALITAAYNVLSKEPAYLFGRRSDMAWQRDYLAATKVVATKERKERKPSKSREMGFVFADVEGESAADRKKRYAKELCKFRYENDPEYANKAREASRVSHAKKRAADAAKKAAEADAAKAAAAE